MPHLWKATVTWSWIFGLWLSGAAGPAGGQLWSGPAALEVRVADSKGKPVSGARVVLLYTDQQPIDGPSPALTDEHAAPLRLFLSADPQHGPERRAYAQLI